MENKTLEKPQESKIVTPIMDPLNTKIEYICPECGYEIIPGSLICHNCVSSLESGINPVLNKILSSIIICSVTILLGGLIGKLFGNVNNGLIGGVGIGVLISSKASLFKSQGIWAMMRLGTSNTLRFFCTTSIWLEGPLPTLVYLSENLHNIYKSPGSIIDAKEKTIIKHFIDAKLNPSEVKTIIVNEDVQKTSPVLTPDKNSTIHITRLSKTRGSFDVFDVYVDDNKVIQLKNGQALKIPIVAGKHELRIQVQNWGFWSDALSFSLDPNETIYITCRSRFNEGPEIETTNKKKS